MAGPQRKSFKVTRDNTFITVYPYKCPTTGKDKWRYCWRETEGSPWRYVTKGKKADIEQSAYDKIGEMGDGFVWSGLDTETKRFLKEVHRMAKPADFESVLAFLASRRKSAEIVESVARFMAHQVAQEGEETRHLSNVRRHVEAMANHFAGRCVADIHDADLMAWWKDRVLMRDKKGTLVLDEQGSPRLLSEKTRNDVRSSMVGFWNWAVWDKLLPKEVTPADKLPRVKDPEPVTATKRVLTPDEMLRQCAEVRQKWRISLVLGGFFGMRPEEIAPLTGKRKSRRKKRGLRAEEIDWTFRVIRVPEEVSKVDTARNIPFPEHAEEWLRWAGFEPGMTGPVCDQNMTDGGETGRLGPIVFGEEGWPQNALRHTYGSCRNAMIRNLHQVAEEMGTSVDRMNKNYHNPRTLEEGQGWFGLRPSMIRFDPMESGSCSDSEEFPRAVCR